MSILGQAGSGLQCRTCLPADRIATLVHTYDCELKLVGSLTGYRKTYGDAEAVGIDGLGHEYRRARRLAQQKGFVSSGSIAWMRVSSRLQLERRYCPDRSVKVVKPARRSWIPGNNASGRCMLETTSGTPSA
jgi:hypothetical protein